MEKMKTGKIELDENNIEALYEFANATKIIYENYVDIVYLFYCIDNGDLEKYNSVYTNYKLNDEQYYLLKKIYYKLNNEEL